MISKLKEGKKIVGLKQSQKAVSKQIVQCAFVAEDAEDGLRNSFISLCVEHKVLVEQVSSMKLLGQACGIEVGAAVAVLLK